MPEELSFQGIIFKINSKEDIVWDFVIVYEDIDEPWPVAHKGNGLLFISGEPPIVKVYSEKFLSQFNHVISSHPNIKHPNNFLLQQSLPWYYGYDFVNDAINCTFEDLVKMNVPTKNKRFLLLLLILLIFTERVFVR